MPKRRTIVLLLAAVALLAGALLFTTRSREPSYNGRTLSDWVTQYGQHSSLHNLLDTTQDLPQARTAAEAIKQIGPKSIPHLLQWMVFEPTTPHKKARERLTQLAERVGVGDKHILWMYNEDIRAVGAIRALHLLGPDAKPAIPELVRMMSDDRKPHAAETAVVALAGIGETGLPALISEATNNNSKVRAAAIGAISDFGAKAASAVPALVASLNEPALAPPMAASEILHQMEVWNAASNALLKIAPEALTNAPPKSP